MSIFRKPPDTVPFRGRRFEVSEDGWVRMDEGDEYHLSLVHVCHNTHIEVACFGASRTAALERACAEIHEILQGHQARCASCQANIVAGLLGREGERR